ncbi:MAG: hypothetical protein ACFFE8_10965 [Candidatus Heimdallarchaeota archaeon]
MFRARRTGVGAQATVRAGVVVLGNLVIKRTDWAKEIKEVREGSN